MKTQIFLDTAGGKLGNRLFQYFFAEMLCEQTDSQFYFIPPSSKAFELNIPELDVKLHQPPSEFDMRIKDGFNIYGGKFSINGEWFPAEIETLVKTINNNKPANVFLFGYFQQYRFYANEINRLKSFIERTEGYKNKRMLEKNSAGLIVRKGDIKNSENDLPDEWYLSFAERNKDKKLYMCSESLEEPVCRSLVKNYDIEVVNGKPLALMGAMAQCSTLCLSQGTFAWWAGFMCEGEVHTCIPKTGWNRLGSGINLNCVPHWSYTQL